MSNKSALTSAPAWGALSEHQKALAHTQIKDLFKEDMARREAFSITHEGLEFDYSKNKLNEKTISLLCDLAKSQNLEEKRDHFFGGMPINTTEKRPALHMALRGSCASHLDVGGVNVQEQVGETLGKIKAFTNKVREEKNYKYIVNIGIGGSDFGPYMVCKSLRHLADPHFRSIFLSNIDPAHVGYYMDQIEPEKTLFIVASKSFTTQETLTNAQTIKDWMVNEKGITNIEDHFCAVTSNHDAAKEFGIRSDMVFDMPKWVGGRFSLWSSVGLSISIAIGFDNFKELLAGAKSADQHFLNMPMEHNIPVLMGLIGIWYRNFWHYETYGVLPYSQNMSQFPQFIQQLEMESNGKSVDLQGCKLDYKTAPVILGGVGTNAQHTFFQLLHQGSDIIPCDFIGIKTPVYTMGDHHEKLIASVIGQTKALMDGSRNDEEPHRNFDGNRPTNTIWLEELTPYNLGTLIAFYEHKVFVQGAIWNINSFDQFGVELGKVLAKEVLKKLQSQ